MGHDARPDPTHPEDVDRNLCIGLKGLFTFELAAVVIEAPQTRRNLRAILEADSYKPRLITEARMMVVHGERLWAQQQQKNENFLLCLSLRVGFTIQPGRRSLHLQIVVNLHARQ